MLTSLPDLDAVRVLVAIAEAGSFQAASRRLGVPRSTVSYRLAGLEAALGVRLVSRTTRRVGLTEAGRAYYEEVRGALQAVDDASRRVAGLAEAPRGPVRVSTSTGFGATWLPEIAAQLLRQHPDVQLVVDLSDRYVDLVAEGYDAAIRGGEGGDTTLFARSLGANRSVCVAAPAYLAGRPPLTHPRDLAQHAALLYSGPLHQEWIFELPERVKVPVSGRFIVNSHRLLVEAAERGLGVARVFPFLVEPALAAGRLVPVLEGWQSPEAHLRVLTAGPRHRTAALEAFLAVVAEVMQRCGGPWDLALEPPQAAR